MRRRRDESSPPQVARLLGGLGVVYLLNALLWNELTLARIGGDTLAMSGYPRIALGLVDALLVALGLWTILERRAVSTAQVNLAILAVLVSIAAVEAALRLREVAPSVLLREAAGLRVMDDRLHHAFAPKTEGRLRWGGRLYRYSTNSLGFRDLSTRDVAREPGKRRRVLILGDSFAECIGVEYRDGFPHRLERLLNGEGIAAEVLSGGVASYSPRFEYRQLREFFERGYVTNVVVLMLDISDVHDEGKLYADWEGHSDVERQAARRKQRAEIEAAERREADLGEILSPRLLRRSRSADSELLPRHLRLPRFRWTEQAELRAEPWIDQGIALCTDFVGKIAALSGARRVELLLVIYPHPTQLVGSHCVDSEFREIFVDVASRNDIALIDLFPIFCQQPNWPEYFISRDIHWNSRGHALVAEALLEPLAAVLR